MVNGVTFACLHYTSLNPQSSPEAGDALVESGCPSLFQSEYEAVGAGAGVSRQHCRWIRSCVGLCARVPYLFMCYYKCL